MRPHDREPMFEMPMLELVTGMEPVTGMGLGAEYRPPEPGS
ncbi:hypothetical protein ACIRPT_09635 [Streptomyces sp. NPDC101227]